MPVLHYLDDVLMLGPPTSSVCTHNLSTIKAVCTELGIPLALEKVEGPSDCLTFLGITLDTNTMEARQPAEKLQRIRNLLSAWLHKWKATKREILSLVGLLQHATKVVKPGRSFVQECTTKQPNSSACHSIYAFQQTSIQTSGGGTYSYATGMV